MVLFPNRYRFGDMTYEWQIKKQIEWKKFRWALNDHFKSLCQIDCDFFLCTQNYSCFRDCKIENLIEDYNDTELVPPVPHLPVLQRSQSPNISRFEPKYLGEWNIVQDRFMHIGTDCFTSFLLLTFMPAFVWAYNELKKVIQVDDKRIRLFEYWKRCHEETLSMKKEEASEVQLALEVRDFTAGTGSEVRAHAYFRRLFAEERERENDTVKDSGDAELAQTPPGLRTHGGGQASASLVGGQYAIPFVAGQPLTSVMAGQALPQASLRCPSSQCLTWEARRSSRSSLEA